MNIKSLDFALISCVFVCCANNLLGQLGLGDEFGFDAEPNFNIYEATISNDQYFAMSDNGIRAIDLPGNLNPKTEEIELPNGTEGMRITALDYIDGALYICLTSNNNFVVNPIDFIYIYNLEAREWSSFGTNYWTYNNISPMEGGYRLPYYTSFKKFHFGGGILARGLFSFGYNAENSSDWKNIENGYAAITVSPEWLLQNRYPFHIVFEEGFGNVRIRKATWDSVEETLSIGSVVSENHLYIDKSIFDIHASTQSFYNKVYSFTQSTLETSFDSFSALSALGESIVTLTNGAVRPDRYYNAYFLHGPDEGYNEWFIRYTLDGGRNWFEFKMPDRYVHSIIEDPRGGMYILAVNTELTQYSLVELVIKDKFGEVFRDAANLDEGLWELQTGEIFWTESFPWVYSESHGWWYIDRQLPNGPYLIYDLDLGWFSLKDDGYPVVYSFTINDSLTYIVGSSNPRLFIKKEDSSLIKY